MAKTVKFVDNSKQVKAHVKKLIERSLVEIGIEWQRIAILEINNQPNFNQGTSATTGTVDTGLMRASNKATQPKWVNVDVCEIAVGNTVDYALYVTYGTWKMPKRPWFQNSILNHTQTYENVVLRVFKAA